MVHPSYAANQVLDDLGIASPDDLNLLQEIAWERRALVREILVEGAEARLTIMGRDAIISVSTMTMDIHRKRFSIAHELGHWELHRSQSSLSICMATDINEGVKQASSPAIEQEANIFASALLMPDRFFAPLCKKDEPSFEHIIDLAKKFNVSITAATMRYLQYCREPIAIVYSHDNHIKWYQGTQSFDELKLFIDVRSRLDPSSRAAAFFKGYKILPNMKSVKASSWFSSGKFRSDAAIQEQAITMSNYNAVLTLLWIDDDIEDNDEY